MGILTATKIAIIAMSCNMLTHVYVLTTVFIIIIFYYNFKTGYSSCFAPSCFLFTQESTALLKNPVASIISSIYYQNNLGLVLLASKTLLIKYFAVYLLAFLVRAWLSIFFFTIWCELVQVTISSYRMLIMM